MARRVVDQLKEHGDKWRLNEAIKRFRRGYVEAFGAPTTATIWISISCLK